MVARRPKAMRDAAKASGNMSRLTLGLVRDLGGADIDDHGRARRAQQLRHFVNAVGRMTDGDEALYSHRSEAVAKELWPTAAASPLRTSKRVASLSRHKRRSKTRLPTRRSRMVRSGSQSGRTGSI